MFDILALGECMIRLSPPAHGRLEFSRTLEIDVGGAEFNVAYSAARLGLQAGFISRLPKNNVAAITLNHGRAVGLDVSGVRRVPFDGFGRSDRVGLNFTEVGTRSDIYSLGVLLNELSRITPPSIRGHCSMWAMKKFTAPFVNRSRRLPRIGLLR